MLGFSVQYVWYKFAFLQLQSLQYSYNLQRILRYLLLHFMQLPARIALVGDALVLEDEKVYYRYHCLCMLLMF